MFYVDSKYLKYICVYAMLIIHVFILFGPAYSQENNPKIILTDEEKTWILQHPVVKASNNTGYPPIDFVSAGEPAGFSIDYLNLLAGKVGLKIQYVNYGNWATMVQKAMDQEIDIIQTLTKSEAREKHFNFSSSYINIPIVLYGRTGAAKISDIKDFEGKKIGFIKGHIVSETYKKKYPDLNFIEYVNNNAVLRALSAGEVDVYPGDATTVNFSISQRNITGLEALGNDFIMKNGEISQSIAVHRNNSVLYGILNKAMAAVTMGEYEKIHDKWIVPRNIIYDIGLTKEEMDWLSSKKTITVAAEEKSFPYEFIDNEGKISGISGDFLDEISKRLNIEFVWSGNANWNDGLTQYQSHEVDMIAVVTPTLDREGLFIFTEPYMRFEQAIFTLKNNKAFTSLETLNGYRLSLAKNTAIVEYIKKDFPDINVIEAEDAQQAVNLVLTGRADAYIGDIPFVNSLLPAIGNTDLIVTGISPYKMESAVGVQPTLPLLASSIEKALSDISPLKKNEIFNKWLQIKVSPGINYGPLGYVLAIFLIISIGVLFWIRTMRLEIKRRKTLEEKLKKEMEIKEEYSKQLDFDIERFHSTFKNIATGAIIADSLGNIEIFNEAAEKMFGYSSEEVIGSNVKMLVPEFNANNHQSTGQKKIMDIGRKVSGVRKGGEEFPIHLGIGKMKIKDKVSVIGSITDLTDITRTQYALEQALDEATKSNKAKSTFLAETSHELRTPLNAIIGFSEMLRNKYFGDLNEKQFDYVNDIYDSGSHLLDLINTLLDLTEVESGNKDINKEILQAQNIVTECSTILKHQMMEKNISLEVFVEPDLNIYSDRLALKQVLINILMNAVKYTGQDGEISVHVVNKNDVVEIKITDNGQGIESDILANITEPFFKGKKSAYHAEEGWGLGLAITKLLVEAHGGKLNIESTLGTGTKVTIFLPSLIENACLFPDKVNVLPLPSRVANI